MTYIIGITGRIGTGKSTISKILNQRNIPVIDCDKLGHELYNKDSIAFNDFVNAFGTDIIGEDGNINRKVLSKKIFDNPENVKKISEISWPAIYKLLQQRIEEYKQQNIKIVGVEAALLIKADWSIITSVWQTRVEDSIIIQRLKQRNNLSEEEAIKRISNQPSQEEYDAKSNVTFDTNKTIEETSIEINNEIDKVISMFQ